MQRLKLNQNAVGATSSRPHCEGMTPNKGITLIALIITIIVMLILVGVTINVALNGGLFEKAETATNETNKALEKEELMQIVVAEYNVQTKIVNVDNVKAQATKYTEDASKGVDGETLVLQGESGTLWEINLESALVKEYEKTTTSTIWEQRGLTSADVKFDTLYYSSSVEKLSSNPSGLSICLFENGDICINFSTFGADVLEPFDEEGNNILGNGGLASAQVGEYMNNSGVTAFSNGFSFPYDSDDTITIRYTSDNKINVYYKDIDDNTIELENGNVPENDNYLVGTLLPQ